jgi:hypothetical protein
MIFPNLWIFVMPVTAIFLIQLIVRLSTYVKKTDFIRFAILLHSLQLIWHISALFSGIPLTAHSYILIKLFRYVMVFIPSALIMVALCIDENYKVKPLHLWFAFAPPLFFYIALNLAPTGYISYGNYFLSLTTSSQVYMFSVLMNMVYYFAFVMIMFMNIDRFYRFSKRRDFYFFISLIGAALPGVLTFVANFKMVSTQTNVYSFTVPLLTLILYVAMELPRLRFFDSVQLSNRINLIDYPIAIYDVKGRRQGFNTAYRTDIYPNTDFRSLETLLGRRRIEPILSIRGRHYKAVDEPLYHEAKLYATAVYFNEITEMRKNILDQEEKIRRLDALNDQLLEDMVIQEKLILETHRQEIFATIQSKLIASYQDALDRLENDSDLKTLDEVKSALQDTLAQLRATVKELRSQAEEIMDIGRLIETCVSLYDSDRLKIKIEPVPALTVLTFAQASAIYLAVRQILDFASLQPECYAADIVLQKERGRPVIVTGLRCHKKIDDHLISEFEQNVFSRGSKQSEGVNLMNSDTGCIIYAVLEP